MSAIDPKRTSGACHTHAILPDCRSFGSLCGTNKAGVFSPFQTVKYE